MCGTAAVAEAILSCVPKMRQTMTLAHRPSSSKPKTASGSFLRGTSRPLFTLSIPITTAKRYGSRRSAEAARPAAFSGGRRPTVGTFSPPRGTGCEKVWSTPHPPCGNRKPCSPTQAAAVSATAGVVFSGSNDGRIRAYSTQDGKILWEYDTVQEFATVNAVKARGGSVNNGGPAIAGGMVFTNAGYSHHSGIIPGNVLLAFSAQ